MQSNLFFTWSSMSGKKKKTLYLKKKKKKYYIQRGSQKLIKFDNKV